MNLVLHLFRKDLRVKRWPLLFLVIWALGIMLWYSLLPTEKRMEHIGALSLWRYFIWLMCFLIIGGQTQRDAPFREGAFFRTRPMGLSTVLQAKGLYALLIIVLSATIISVSILMLGLKPGALDFLLVFTEELLVLSALGAVSMALALQQENVGKYLTSLAGLFFALFIGWIAFTWFKSWYFHHEKPDWSYDLEYLKLSRSLTAQFVTLAGSIIGIRLFVRSRRRETITKSLALTAVCTIAALFCWPVNFVKAFAPALREAPKNERPDQSKLKAIIDPTAHSQSPFTKYSNGYNEVRYQSINSDFRIEGLSPDWFPDAGNGYDSRVLLADGRTIHRKREPYGTVHPTAVLHQLKMKPLYPTIGEREWQAELTDFKLQNYAGSLSGARLSGELLLPLKRAVILTRVPLKEGLSIHIPGRRIQIPKIEMIGDELHCTVIEESACSTLRGGFTRLSKDSTEFLIIQKDRGEFVEPNGSGQTGNTAGSYYFRKTDFKGVIFPPNVRKPITADWLAGAEFLLIGQESGGTLSQPFDFSNVNLGNEQ